MEAQVERVITVSEKKVDGLLVTVDWKATGVVGMYEVDGH